MVVTSRFLHQDWYRMRRRTPLSYLVPFLTTPRSSPSLSMVSRLPRLPRLLTYQSAVLFVPAALAPSSLPSVLLCPTATGSPLPLPLQPALVPNSAHTSSRPLRRPRTRFLLV